MKIQLKSSVAALCLAGLIAAPALAAKSTHSTDSVQIKKISAEVARLQAEVKVLKNERAKNKKVYVKETRASSQSTTNNSSADASSDVQSQKRLTKQQLTQFIREERTYLPFDLDVPGQAFVSTGPYVGVPIQFAGDELVINSPSVNTDLQLLGIRKSILTQLQAMGGQIVKEPYHSHLLLSGVVETEAGYLNQSGPANGGLPASFIDVSNVSLDAFFLGPSEWLLGFIEFSYDSGPATLNSFIVSNSRVFINKAFITIGDLLLSPIYGTFGQFYVPFGRYSSIMISDTLTKLLTRTKARAVLLGVSMPGDNAFYGSTYVFRGDSHVNSYTKIGNGGINLGYKFKTTYLSGDIGGGVIANIADSGGMQLGNGFSGYEQLHHRVPGYNLRGILGIGDHLNFIGEFVTASTQFNPNDMSFNGHGAKPWALDTELSYTFTILDNKPSLIGIGYSKTNEALSLGLPLNRYSLVLNTSLWRNTLQAIEFRRDRQYAASYTGNGPTGAASTPGACTSAACTQTGKIDRAVTASFDYYF